MRTLITLLFVLWLSPAHAVDISDDGYTYLCDFNTQCTAPAAGHARLGSGSNFIVSGRALASGEVFDCYIYNQLFGQNMPSGIQGGDPVYCYFEAVGTGGSSTVDADQIAAINALLPGFLVALAAIWGVKRIHKLLDSGRSEE